MLTPHHQGLPIHGNTNEAGPSDPGSPDRSLDGVDAARIKKYELALIRAEPHWVASQQRRKGLEAARRRILREKVRRAKLRADRLSAASGDRCWPQSGRAML